MAITGTKEFLSEDPIGKHIYCQQINSQRKCFIQNIYSKTQLLYLKQNLQDDVFQIVHVDVLSLRSSAQVDDFCGEGGVVLLKFSHMQILEREGVHQLTESYLSCVSAAQQQQQQQQHYTQNTKRNQNQNGMARGGWGRSNECVTEVVSK